MKNTMCWELQQKVVFYHAVERHRWPGATASYVEEMTARLHGMRAFTDAPSHIFQFPRPD